MRITHRGWAALVGAQMFIIGVFGTPHRTLAQVGIERGVLTAIPASATPKSAAPMPAAPMPSSAGSSSSAATETSVADPNSVRLLVGRSTLVNVGTPISRVSLTSADVADALVTAPDQLLVHGKVPGTISMFVWSRGGGGVKRFEVVVSRDLARLNEQFQQLFPGEHIEAQSTGKQVTLYGNVSRKEIADKAIAVAAGYVDNKDAVVNLLAAQPGPPTSQVLLRVRFAEVSRSAMTEAGMSIFTSPIGIHNNIGRVTTQQFPSVDYKDLQWSKADTLNPDGSVAKKWSDFGSDVASASGKLEFSDFLNLFLLNEKYDLGALIKALKSRGLFQSLAEPNLVAESGKEASFLAGGEFPVPVAQGSGSNLAISVQYKEFGVRLNFTPTVNGDRVHLKVKPEVSTLDFGNAVVLSGFRIPALSTRRTETELELRNGQTFAIAGLMNNQMQSTMQKVPGIGDIPILGALFKSKAAQKDQTELVVMITPEILPSDSRGVTPNLPKFGDTFLPPIADKQAKPAPAPAFTGAATRSNAAVDAAPVDDRTAIERTQDQARAQSDRVNQVAAPQQPQLTEKQQRAAAKQADADAKKHAAEQKRLDALMSEQAKRDAESAAKAKKEADKYAEADRKNAEKLAREQAKRDAKLAKEQAKADKEAAEQAARADADAAPRSGR
ncbi:MAG TPA: type II and III secretion system protein family protein [Vicinamibacterales bacterium]